MLAISPMPRGGGPATQLSADGYSTVGKMRRKPGEIRDSKPVAVGLASLAWSNRQGLPRCREQGPDKSGEPADNRPPEKQIQGCDTPRPMGVSSNRYKSWREIHHQQNGERQQELGNHTWHHPRRRRCSLFISSARWLLSWTKVQFHIGVGQSGGATWRTEPIDRNRQPRGSDGFRVISPPPPAYTMLRSSTSERTKACCAFRRISKQLDEGPICGLPARAHTTPQPRAGGSNASRHSSHVGVDLLCRSYARNRKCGQG